MRVKTRTGNIKTNRIDKAETNKEKQKFERFQNLYRNILVNVAVSIKTLEELTEQIDGNVIFSNYCPAFTTAVLKNFWAQSVIKLNECFKGDHSFDKFINYIKANWNKIYTGKWEEITDWNDNTTEREEISFGRTEIFKRIEEVEQILDEEENKQIIEKIKDFRDKAFAHTDDDSPKNVIHLTELRKAFSFAENIFNKLQVMYDRCHTCLEPSNSDDVKNIIHIVDLYNKYKTQIREIDFRERYER